jgi:light-regulated signal transduction histidine kinase (bacteriophytochrome)
MADRSCESQLEATRKELADFSYSVSHDLRAPLRTVIGFSDALAEDFQDKLGAEGAGYVRRIRDAAVRMDRMIDAVVELARLSRQEMKHERVDLTAIAHSIASELQQFEPARKVSVRVDPGLAVHGDAALLGIAMRCLIENAWKFTSRRPAATIEICRDGKAILVRDDGAGFDPAYAEKMFGAFQRLHPANDYPGLGVGLVTVQRIVNRHGGKVWASSQLDRGTTIYLELE